MATYFVASGGSNTSPYDTWAKAATALQTALTAASGGSDVVVIQYNAVPSGDAELASDTSYTTTNSVSLIAASADDANTAYTPTAMNTSYWIGNSTTNRAITFSGGADDKVYIYGITFRNAGTGDKNIAIAATTGCSCLLEGCYIWLGNSGSSSRIVFGVSTVGVFVVFSNCTFRFGAVNQSFNLISPVFMNNCVISSDGSAVNSLFSIGQYVCYARIHGCDLSRITGTLISNSVNVGVITFDRCKLGSGVTVLATQTSNPTLASASAEVFDCSSGDTHGLFGFYNALGSVVSDTGLYFTGGAASQSWKIVTSDNASFWSPFITPWINLYHTGTSAITPYFEILRDGSATAYQDDEIWAEFVAKVTASSVVTTLYTDRKSIDTDSSAADQAAGVGAGSWTGEQATVWSGKIDSGSSLTPAEAGYISGRICVGEPSITVYVNPQIIT